MTKHLTMASLGLMALFLTAARAADVLVEDKSLTVDQYKIMGFPDSSRSWTLDDLKTAGKAFALLAKQDPTMLPRANSAQSGKLFARLVSLDPLTTIRRKTDQLQRIQDLTAACMLMAQISKPYVTPPAGTYFDAEVTQLDGITARYTGAIIHEFSAARTPGDDADYETTITGLTKNFLTAIHRLAPGTNFSLASRQQLLKDLDSVFRDVMVQLPASVQASLVKGLQQNVEMEPDPDFTKKEQALVDWLRKNSKK